MRMRRLQRKRERKSDPKILPTATHFTHCYYPRNCFIINIIDPLWSVVVKIGFTGTREGMNLKQVAQVEALLRSLDVSEVHHGDCLGADTEFHFLAKSRGHRIIVHPPIDPKLRAYCKGDQIREPRPYHERNYDIVHSVDILIACPKQNKEIQRSGTWHTIRTARIAKHIKRIYIFAPN